MMLLLVFVALVLWNPTGYMLRFLMMVQQGDISSHPLVFCMRFQLHYMLITINIITEVLLKRQMKLRRVRQNILLADHIIRKNPVAK